MRIGYWYLLVGDGIHPVELGRELEERGAEGLFAGEHTNLPVGTEPADAEQAHIHPRVADPLTVLSMLAGATERLTLGTSVLLAATDIPSQAR